MNALPPFLLLSLALLVGCSPAAKEARVDGCGGFPLTNATGTVFWGHVQDAKTNELQFILLLPESAQSSSGCQTHGAATYDYCDLKTKRDGHQWKIEAKGNLNAGTESLQLSDLTANTVTHFDLGKSRWWQISDDRTLIALDKIDPAITKKVLHDSDAGFKSIQPLP